MIKTPFHRIISHESFLLCTLPGLVLPFLMCSTFSSSYPLILCLLPPSWCFRKLFPQGPRFLNLITLWNPPLVSLPPSPHRLLTAPPGYAAWVSMMVTLMVKMSSSERYLAVCEPDQPCFPQIIIVVMCHL